MFRFAADGPEHSCSGPTVWIAGSFGAFSAYAGVGSVNFESLWSGRMIACTP
jgi:hypothetical protein